jgi:predicted secreted hydrolase
MVGGLGLARRALLLAALPLPALALQRRALSFPRDFGAHPDSGLEWWYLTGLLGEREDAAPLYGYQLTFFRVRHPDAAVQQHPSALAPRQLLLGHVALSDLRSGRLQHGQRVARLGLGARCAETDCDLVLQQDWRLQRLPDDRYTARFGAERFALELALQTGAAPPLLQGEAGWSRKGPEERQVSHYYSRPQLQTRGRLRLDGRTRELVGRAWMDHEWSDQLLAPQAVGWDWLGINLLDGRALTAFQLRRADGSALWSGGSWRAGDGDRSFPDGALQFTPLRRWRSPLSGAQYPVEWRLQGPGIEGWRLRAMFDAQEIDARASSGLLYWEGAAALEDAQGRLLGRGYLELTGYAARMKLGAIQNP